MAACFNENVLGVTIDSELHFANHITEICLNALCRISSFTSIEKCRSVMKYQVSCQ